MTKPAVPRLSQQSASALSAYRALPFATRPAPGVVHLGLGAFHRAHQALAFDDLLHAGDARWGVFGVAMKSRAVVDALAAQDLRYSVEIASGAGVAWRIPNALFDTAVAATERERVVAAIAAPDTRWITLTVTEKGYTPELAALIVDGLKPRFAAGLPGLTIASCDNLSNNGAILQSLCETEINKNILDGPMIAWLQGFCAFPNSMVDRIVPASTPERSARAAAALGIHDAAALGTEAFTEWVIERRFADPNDAAALASVGVTVVDDVQPFAEAKLRMLNGSHSAMAAMGAIAGLPFIASCIGEPRVKKFIHDLMTEEIAPHLTRPDWAAYRDALIARFGNPQLRHSVHQIATDSTLKIPQRWVPVAVLRRARGLTVSRLVFCTAVFMRWATGVNEQGVSYSLNDPIAGKIEALVKSAAGDTKATVRALASLTEIWGDTLAADAEWWGDVEAALARINALGVLAALEDFA